MGIYKLPGRDLKHNETPVMKRYRLRAKLLKHQMKFVYNTSKFPGLVAGYGAGKTEALIRRALYLKYKNKSVNVAYYLPTYSLIETIAWPRFIELLTGARRRFKLNETKKRLDIEGAGTIFFRSMEKPETIVGFEVGHALVDELDTLSLDKAQKAFIKIIGRNRTPIPGGGVNSTAIGTTPEGFGWMYQNYEKNLKPGFELIRASTFDNPFLPESYIQGLIDAYPAELIQAYLNGEFVNLNGLVVYSNYNRYKHNSREKVEPGDVIHAGQDFNVGNQSTTIGVYRGEELHIVDEIAGALDTPATVEIMKTKYPGHKIVFYPDPAGNSRDTRGASLTDFSILRKAGFIVDAPPAHPRVRDRIISVQLMFKDSRSVAHLKINSERCPALVECLECQVYDEAGQPDKKTGFDHLPDALGYLIHRRHSPNTLTVSRIASRFY